MPYMSRTEYRYLLQRTCVIYAVHIWLQLQCQCI